MSSDKPPAEKKSDENKPEAALNLPVSVNRIRQALAQPAEPLKGLKGLDETPTFRVEIRERQRFENLLATLDFKSGPVPPGGLYGFEQRARLSSPWGSQPIVGVDVLSIARLIGNGVSSARRSHAEAAAREEVKRALEEFWAAQQKR